MRLSLQETVQEMINSSIAFEVRVLNNRIDVLEAQLSEKTRELEAIWEHVKPRMSPYDAPKEVPTYRAYALGRNDFVVDPRFIELKSK